MARQIRAKAYARTREDLLALKNLIESNFTQVYSSSPMAADHGDFYIKFTIVIGDWEEEPATQRQLLALLSMGVVFEDSITKGEASQIIRDQMIRRATA